MNLLDNEEQIAQKLKDQAIDGEAKRYLRFCLKAGALVVLIIAAFACCMGCAGLIPSEHKEQVAVTTAGNLSTKHTEEMTKRFATPPVEVKLGGIGNKLQLYSPTATPLTPTVTVPQAKNAQILNYGPATPGGTLSVASSFPQQNEVTIKSTEDIDSNGNDKATSASVHSIPVGVRWILAAAGLAAIFGVLLWIYRSVKSGALGAGAAAGLAVGDKALANSISSVEAMLHATSDQGQKQVALAILNDLNKSRGKLAAATPAPPPQPPPAKP